MSLCGSECKRMSKNRIVDMAKKDGVIQFYSGRVARKREREGGIEICGYNSQVTVVIQYVYKSTA